MKAQRQGNFSLFAGLYGAFLIILILASYLLIAKAEQSIKSNAHNTALTSVDPLLKQIQDAYALGLYPENTLQNSQLEAALQSSSRIGALGWYSPSGQRLFFAGDDAQLPEHVQPHSATHAIDLSNHGLHISGETQLTFTPVDSTFGQVIGYLGMQEKTPEITTLHKKVLQQAITITFGLALVGGLIMWLALRRINVSSNPHRSDWLIILLTTLSMVLLGWMLLQSVAKLIHPMQEERLASIAQSELRLWKKAELQGFNFDAYKPITPYLKSLEKDHPEVGQALVETPDKKVESGDAVIPVDAQHQIVMTPNPSFLDHLKKQLALDYLTLAVVLYFFWAQLTRKPEVSETWPNEEKLKKRLPALLFVYFLSEEFMRPFLPVLAQTTHLKFLPESFQAWIPGLTISVFMLLVACSQPFLARITSTDKALRMLKIGCGLTIAGQTLLYLNENAVLLLAGRALAGLGYACVFVMGQTLLLMMHDQKHRATAFATLVTSIMAATVVGPAFGGLIAANLGPLIPLVLSILSPLLVFVMLSATRVEHAQSTPSTLEQSQSAGWLPGIRNSKLLCLMFGAAVPAKMMLTGLIFLLLPLLASRSSDLGVADVGRFILLYGLIMLVFTPKFANLVKRLQTREHTRLHWFIGGGLLLSACVGIAPWLETHHAGLQLTDWAVAIGIVVALGVGQSISISAQASMVPLLQHRYAPELAGYPWLGTYRLIERMGNVAGPFAVTIGLHFLPANDLLMTFSVGALACGLFAFWTLKT